MIKAVNILVVEDKGNAAFELQSRLRRLGLSVAAVVASGLEAIGLAEQVQPDIVLMNIRLGGESLGLEIAAQIRALFGIPIIFMTTYGDTGIRQRASVIPNVVFLAKPFADSDLLRSILIALRAHKGRPA